MSDTAPLTILPAVISNDTNVTGGLNNPPTGSQQQNEGSFLDFLNAFNALSSTNSGALETSLEGGSTLPLAIETADAGRTPLLNVPVSQAQAVTAETGLLANDSFIATQFSAATNTVLPDTTLAAPLTELAEGGLPGETDLSSRVSSAALASRLVGLAQSNNLGHSPANEASDAINPSASALINSQLSTSQPITTGDSLLAAGLPQQVSNQPQLAAVTGLTNKDLLTRPGSVTTTKPGTASTVSSLQPTELSISEADTFFAAQVKKMVAEQQAGLNPERSMVQNTLASMTANTSNNHHVSTAQMGIQNPTAAPLLTTETVSTTSLQATVSETFGRPEWGQGMGKQVLMMANQNIRSAELRLNPAHLGPIEVHIEMEDDQVNLAFSSRHAAVREAVEQAMPRLREMFEESGLNLADTDVSQQSFAEQRSQESAKHSDHQRGGFDNQSDANSLSATGDSDSGNRSSVDVGLVDYYI